MMNSSMVLDDIPFEPLESVGLRIIIKVAYVILLRLYVLCTIMYDLHVL